MSVWIRNRAGNRDRLDRTLEVHIFQEPMGGGIFVDVETPSLTLLPFTAIGQFQWLWLACDANGANAQVIPLFPPAVPTQPLKRVIGAWGTVDSELGADAASTRMQMEIVDREHRYDHGYEKFGFGLLSAIRSTSDFTTGWKEFDIADALPTGLCHEAIVRLEAKRIDHSGLAQNSVATRFDPAIPYFHPGLTQAKAYGEVNQGGECSLDNAHVLLSDPGGSRFSVFISPERECQILCKGFVLLPRRLPLPAAGEEGTTGEPTGSVDCGNNVFADLSWSIDQGRTVDRLGFDTNAAGSYVGYIIRRNAPGSFNVVRTETITHPGGGRQMSAIAPWTHPNDGATYHAAIRTTAGAVHPVYANKLIAYTAGSISGNGVAMTEVGPSPTLKVPGICVGYAP